MEGRLQPFLPELTIRDYNTYLWYLRGVRRQMYLSYGLYSCRYLRHNGVLYALLADSLAGRTATCKRARLPGTLCWKTVMCQTQGIRLAAQVEVMMAWHRFQDRKWTELELGQRLRRGLDRLLLRPGVRKSGAGEPGLGAHFYAGTGPGSGPNGAVQSELQCGSGANEQCVWGAVLHTGHG